MPPADSHPPGSRVIRPDLPADSTAGACCVQCGYPIPDRPLGCRWPCEHCGFLYPQGDCSD